MRQPKDESLDGDAQRPTRSVLSEAARRALAEAEERRRRAAAKTARPAVKEVNGSDGPEPVRYGDWEVKGIATDF